MAQRYWQFLMVQVIYTGERGEGGLFCFFFFFCLYKQHVTEQTPGVDVKCGTFTHVLKHLSTRPFLS